MVTTIRRKGVFAGMVTTVAGVVIGLPFTILHPLLPFVILLVSFGLFLGLRPWLGLPKYPLAYWSGCLIALVLLLPAVSMVKFAEQGFDDGPFYGTDYTQGVMGLEVSDRVDYRQGELLIYNRQVRSAPVLVYRVGEDIRWAREMDISQHSQYQGYRLSSMSDPVMAYGIVRDRLDFTGTWDFGTERGRAYLWKWGGFHRFYLSW